MIHDLLGGLCAGKCNACQAELNRQGSGGRPHHGLVFHVAAVATTAAWETGEADSDMSVKQSWTHWCEGMSDILMAGTHAPTVFCKHRAEHSINTSTLTQECEQTASRGKSQTFLPFRGQDQGASSLDLHQTMVTADVCLTAQEGSPKLDLARSDVLTLPTSSGMRIHAEQGMFKSHHAPESQL